MNYAVFPWQNIAPQTLVCIICCIWSAPTSYGQSSSTESSGVCQAAFSVVFVDNCGHVQLNDQSTGNLPISYQWSNSDATPGLDLQLNCGQHTYCLSITDADMCMSSVCQTFTVVDQVPPVAICQPGFGVDLDPNCNFAVTPALIDAGSTDNCQIQSMSVSPTVLTGCGDFSVTLTVIDGCNNTHSCTTGIQTMEIMPPTALCVPDFSVNLDLTCTFTLTPVMLDAGSTDNCQIQSLTLSNNLLQGCGIFPLTLTVKDECGWEDICSTNITTIDVSPPSIVCPADQTVATDPGLCTYTGTIALATATDACDPSPDVVCSFVSNGSSVLVTPQTQFPQGLHTITCIATDDCGNQSQTCNYLLKVEDKEAPSITCPLSVSIIGSLDQQGQCHAIFNGISPLITDNCTFLDTLFSITGSIVSSGTGDASGSNFGQGISTVTYTVTDVGGNIHSCFFDIEVQCPPVPDLCLDWAHQFISTQRMYTAPHVIDAAGNIYMTGVFFGNVDFDPGPASHVLSSTGQDVFILKLDAMGQFVWVVQLGAKSGSVGVGEGKEIKIDPFGNIYVLGTFIADLDFDPGPGVVTISSGGYRNTFVTKFDANGNWLWAKSIRSFDDLYLPVMTIDPQGNILLGGPFEDQTDVDPGPATVILHPSNPGYPDNYVAKLDGAGNLLWARQFAASAQCCNFLNAIESDGAGNVYLVGRLSGTTDFDPGPGVYNLTSAGSYDMFICKLDAAGQLLWAKQLGQPSREVGAADMVVNATGHIFLTGGFNGTIDFDPGPGSFPLTANANDAFILHLDPSGAFVWARHFTGNNSEAGWAIDVGPGGHIYSLGVFPWQIDLDPGPGFYIRNSTFGFGDQYISQLDPFGHFVGGYQIQGGGGGFSNTSGKLVALSVDQQGCLYTTSTFGSTMDVDPGPAWFTLHTTGPAGYVYKVCPCSVLPTEEPWQPEAGIILYPPYLNPLNAMTTIAYELGSSTFIRLSVFDLLGREVSVLISERQERGTFSVPFYPAHLSAGTYYCILQTGSTKIVQKMVILP